MGRPRKNPDDPKWNEPQETHVNDDWRIFFAAALGGLIARGSGQTYDQMIKTASEIAKEAQKSIQ
jgi:phosphopantothenate synthetase